MTDTLSAHFSYTTEVKHSRFIAHAAPVASSEQALYFVGQVSDADATHNCWAYRIGKEYRSNDDNEPAGTAGRPILAAIDGQNCDRVVVVVTRWFGGIKLGAGGLARAYGGTAAECLRHAERHRLIEMIELTVACPFDELGTLHTALSLHSVEKTSEHFEADGAHLSLRLPSDQLADLKTYLRNASCDRIRFLNTSTQ
ncbi:MAG: IMPACT family protein [Xanthomonadaceae bacterium]|jgi:uncharacterized YigZ family protein|nr:IMPACT family protein [Xanthomonadaceae bacterium]